MKVANPIEEINKAIPELESIASESNIEYVSYRNWGRRLKAIETENLKKYKRSTAVVSMGLYFMPCIIELQSDNKIMVINKDKYKLIRQYMLSEEYNLHMKYQE